MRCGNCNAELAQGEKFCGECGCRADKVNPTCPSCGLEVGPEERFCGKCGHELQSTPSSTRKQTGQVEASGEPKVFRGHKDEVLSVDLSPDGIHAVSSGGAGSIIMYESTTGREVQRFVGHRSIVTGVAFSPDGRLILSGGWDKTIRLWDAATGREVRKITPLEKKKYLLEGPSQMDVSSLAFSADGRLGLSGSDHPSRMLKGKGLKIAGVVLSSLGPSTDATVFLFDVGSGREIGKWTLPGGFYVNSVAFSHDGRYAACSDMNRLHMWDLENMHELKRWTGLPFKHTHKGAIREVRSLAFSPNGSQLLTGGSDNLVRLWDIERGREIRKLAGHEKRVNAVAYSPDGRHLLSGSDDNIVMMWDVDTGEHLRSLSGHSDRVNCVKFSADGRHGISASSDGTARLWSLF